MFKSRNYKIYIMTLLQIVGTAVLLAGYFVEFISFFLITDSFSFVQLPLHNASIVEFTIFTSFSVLLSLLSIWIIRSEKIANAFEYSICSILVIVNLAKLLFYVLSISFDKEYFFYLIKQFVPLLTNLATVFFGVIQISEIKYKRAK